MFIIYLSSVYHLCIICVSSVLFVKIGSFSCNSCRNLWSLEDPKTQSSPVSRPIPNLGTTGTTEGWLSKVRRRTRWFDGAIAKSTVQFWQCWSCEISLRKSMVLDGKGWFWQDVEWWQFSKDSLDKGLDVFRCSVLTMFCDFQLWGVWQLIQGIQEIPSAAMRRFRQLFARSWDHMRPQLM